MRANLDSSGERSSLKQELETARIYQRIEDLRLGDRLSVRWDVAELPMRARIPSLTIQPLLENAIYHGIELLPDGGEVVVSGKKLSGSKSAQIDSTMRSMRSSPSCRCVTRTSPCLVCPGLPGYLVPRS